MGMKDVAVDTAGLDNNDPTTVPELPAIRAKDVAPSWTQFLLEGDHDQRAALRDFARPRLMPFIVGSAHDHVEVLQRVCGIRPVSADELISSPDSRTRVYGEAWQDPAASIALRLWSFLCSSLAWFGAFLGGELFYITVFPFLFWNIDQALGRRVVYLWVMSMYVGQGAKDHMRLPRPAVVNRRVRSIEGHWLAEYGFPSTHAMSVMGQASMVVWYTFREDYAGANAYPIGLACSLAVLVVTMTCVGRLYLGVHTLPDILGGLAIEAVVFYLFTGISDPLDHFVLSHEATMYLPTIVLVVFLLIYPRPARWTNAAVMKLIFTNILEAVVPKSPIPAENRYIIGVPSKFIAYTAVAFMAVGAMPTLFRAAGLTLDIIRE